MNVCFCLVADIVQLNASKMELKKRLEDLTRENLARHNQLRKSQSEIRLANKQNKHA